MAEKLQYWTTVGSAGMLNQTDLAKVFLHQSIIQLGVDGPLPPQAAAARQFAAAAVRVSPLGPVNQAVVRYNVAPVESLRSTDDDEPVYYSLQLRYRGQVSAGLMEVDRHTGAERQLALFDSHKFAAAADFQLQQEPIDHTPPVFDFIEKAYYVEAVLTAPLVVIGHPAAISIVKIVVPSIV
jgi:hypothetical protein